VGELQLLKHAFKDVLDEVILYTLLAGNLVVELFILVRFRREKYFGNSV